MRILSQPLDWGSVMPLFAWDRKEFATGNFLYTREVAQLQISGSW